MRCYKQQFFNFSSAITNDLFSLVFSSYWGVVKLKVVISGALTVAYKVQEDMTLIR